MKSHNTFGRGDKLSLLGWSRKRWTYVTNLVPVKKTSNMNMRFEMRMSLKTEISPFEKTTYVPEKRNASREVINKFLENIFKSEYQ